MTSDVPDSTTWVPDPEVVALYDRYIRDHHGELNPIEWGAFARNDGKHVGARIAYHTLLTFSDLLPTLQKFERSARRLVQIFGPVSTERN